MSFFETVEPEFERFVLGNAPVKQLASGFDWVEGPVWFGDAGCLLFSDIPNDRVLRWTPGEGVSTYRQPSNYANGHTRDRQGRLVSCEHGTRRVTRTENDGRITVIADGFEGRPLNSPNDVVVAQDGGIWFSDPHYGIMTNYEGFAAEQENPCVVYRADPGRMFSQDAQEIRVYDIVDGRPAKGRPFHRISPGCADGFRLDSEGNLWSSAADGIHCIAPDGRLLGKILVPELVSNLCFGGRAKHELYITASTSLYRITLNRQGVQAP